MEGRQETLTVQITNVPLRTATRRHEDGRVELIGGAVNALDGRLRVVPSTDCRVQELVRGDRSKALKTISAMLFLAPDLPQNLVPEGRTPPDTATIVCCTCDLLSFASRRGVSFVPGRRWWSGQKPVIRGRCQSRGP